MSNTIFIQIAAYRDPELIPTIHDCITNADNPDNLYFGICRQFHEDDKFDDLTYWRKNPNFRIIDVPYLESEGACWARNLIQQLYKGEDYTLQLDSHHRFAKGWDTALIDMIRQLQDMGHEKPLLTTYAPSYDPENDPGKREKAAWKMDFHKFIPEGAVFFLPAAIPGWKDLIAPIPARFYSAHCSFSIGKFAVEVQHDPEYYFHGEEISIAVRAFTHGYDLFHPHRPLIWHEYTRKGRTKHWDDHSTKKVVEKPWHKRNNECHLRNRKLFGMDGEKQDIDFGKYGFGTVRTLRDYEKYAGLNFKLRAAQQYTLDRKNPPNPVQEEAEDAWIESFCVKNKVKINIPMSEVDHTDDIKFWFVGAHDNSNKEIYRQDLVAEKINVFAKSGTVNLDLDFMSSSRPHTWTIWPYSKSKQWLTKLTKKI
tara:strand:+ start:4055 stop:5326 length:1272 start_codon:yes stop_codon:yes gene_type:complete